MIRSFVYAFIISFYLSFNSKIYPLSHLMEQAHCTIFPSCPHSINKFPFSSLCALSLHFLPFLFTLLACLQEHLPTRPPTPHSLLLACPPHLLQLLQFILLIIRMFDRQAPDIQKIANGCDDVILSFSLSLRLTTSTQSVHKHIETHHKAPINPNRQPHTQHHKRNLISPISQCARPEPQHWSCRIKDRKEKGYIQDIMAWKIR